MPELHLVLRVIREPEAKGGSPDAIRIGWLEPYQVQEGDIGLPDAPSIVGRGIS